MKLVSLVWSTIFLLALTGCGGGDEQPSSRLLAGENEDPSVSHSSDIRKAKIEHLVQNLGGVDKLEELVKSGDLEKLDSTLRNFGIDYRQDLRNTAKATNLAENTKSKTALSFDPNAVEILAVTECLRFFPIQDRGATYWYSGHEGSYTIDLFGRPSKSIWIGSPAQPVSAGTRTSCTTEIGTWGRGGEDDGGHLVPFILGGSGTRYNVVPQNRTLNRGYWQQLEGVPKVCRESQRARYTVIPNYSSPLQVRPDSFDAEVEVDFLGLFWIPVASIQGVPNEIPAPQTITGIGLFRDNPIVNYFCQS
jgi:hypothetical protein